MDKSSSRSAFLISNVSITLAIYCRTKAVENKYVEAATACKDYLKRLAKHLIASDYAIARLQAEDKKKDWEILVDEQRAANTSSC